MIVHDVQQGSPEWFAVRRSIPTASQFHRILTPSKLTPSAQADKYLDELLAEAVLGEDCKTGDEEFTSPWTHRGIEMEPQAARWYAFEHDRDDVREVGFVTRDDGLVGCSPDRLVGDDGGLEMKCPNAANHMGHLRDPAAFYLKHRMQVQGCLYVTGRKWWDLMSYNPELPPVVTRYHRDEKLLAALGAALDEFVKRLVTERRALKEKGYHVQPLLGAASR